MNRKTELGKIGEDLACGYLVEKGYKIIERNWKKPWGELDIIARGRDKTLVFVEVKTMKHFTSGIKPEDQMTAAKLQKVRRAASLYAGSGRTAVGRGGWRIDALALTVNLKENGGCALASLAHYENI